MSSGAWRTEWGRGPDFAEVADALGVPTDQIMAARNPAADKVWALFCPTREDPPRIFAATLRRDRDNVLRLDGEPVEQPGMWDEIIRTAEGRL